MRGKNKRKILPHTLTLSPQTIALRFKQIENRFCDCLRERGLEGNDTYLTLNGHPAKAVRRC